MFGLRSRTVVRTYCSGRARKYLEYFNIHLTLHFCPPNMMSMCHSICFTIDETNYEVISSTITVSLSPLILYNRPVWHSSSSCSFYPAINRTCSPLAHLNRSRSLTARQISLFPDHQSPDSIYGPEKAFSFRNRNANNNFKAPLKFSELGAYTSPLTLFDQLADLCRNNATY